MIDHGHRFTDILDYRLAQVRGFLAATLRAEAAREARILSLIAVGTRGDVRQLDRNLDRLNDLTRPHAPLRSTR